MHPLVIVGVVDGAYKHHFFRSGRFGVKVHLAPKDDPPVVFDIDLLGLVVETDMVAQGFKVPLAVFGGCAIVSSSWVWLRVAGIRGLVIDVCGCAGDKKKRQDRENGNKLLHNNSPWREIKVGTSISTAQVR
jgi:hypothetical protein